MIWSCNKNEAGLQIQALEKRNIYLKYIKKKRREREKKKKHGFSCIYTNEMILFMCALRESDW